MPHRPVRQLHEPMTTPPHPPSSRATAARPAAEPVAGTLALVRVVRVGEALLMLGFPAVAAVLAAPVGDPAWRSTAVVVIAGLAWIAVSVYAYNSLAGADADAVDPKFHGRDSRRRRGQLAVTAAACLLAGLATFALFEPSRTAAAAALWVVWFCYSHPRGLKRRPASGTLSHVVGGILMTWIPYTAIRPWDPRGAAVVAVLTAGFTAGHLIHEGIDRPADTASGARTTTIVLGPQRAYLLALGIAALGPAAAVAGWAVGGLAPFEALALGGGGLVQLGLGLPLAGTAPRPDQLVAYRRRYRAAFAIACAAACITHLWTV